MAGADLLIQELDGAIRAFAQRQDILPADAFRALDEAAKARAFTVSRIADLDVLADLHKYIESTLASGGGMRDFIDGINQTMEARGWEGPSAWHGRLVFETNVGQAVSAGRFDQARRSGAKYWRYLGSDAAVPREEHKKYYGKIFRMGEGPMPPLDFGCQCFWEVVYEEELNGEEVMDGAPIGIFRPAEFFQPLEVKLSDYPPELHAALKRQAEVDSNLKLLFTTTQKAA